MKQMKNIFTHIKKFISVLAISFFIVILINYSFGKKYDSDSLLQQLLFVFTYTLSIYTANAFVLGYYFSKVQKSWMHYILGLIISALITMLLVVCIDLVKYMIIYEMNIWNSFSYIIIKSVPTLVLATTISITVYVFGLVKLNDKQEVLYQKEIATNATASFESLKNQLDPHFLFNSLNVLSALIEENPEKAQEFTISLSKVYRYVLEQKDKTLISMEEELDFAKLYVSLLQMRFENALIRS